MQVGAAGPVRSRPAPVVQQLSRHKQGYPAIVYGSSEHNAPVKKEEGIFLKLCFYINSIVNIFLQLSSTITQRVLCYLLI